LPYNDGFSFEDPIVEEIRHPHMNYPGYNVTTIACLGQTRTTVRMDLGVGDQVVPEKKSLTLLSLNNKPLFESEISVQVYPLPYIFAEKPEAIAYRGGTNSRMKDFYDILTIAELTDFSLRAGIPVVRVVFDHRQTPLPRKMSYDQQAINTLSRGWKRFIGTLEDEFTKKVPKEFTEVSAKINDLLHALVQE